MEMYLNMSTITIVYFLGENFMPVFPGKYALGLR